MRRRTTKAERSTTPPARLRVYDARDWPNPHCHPECAFWAAVETWREEHLDEAGLNGAGTLGLVDGPDTPWHPELI